MNTEHEYIKQHLEKEKEPKKSETIKTPIIKNTLKRTGYDFIPIDCLQLPTGMMYPIGTIIEIRAAETAEIQAYSTVDNGNLLDIYEKLDMMLSACIRIKYPGGRLGSYLDLKESDKLYLIFFIRDLTFQNKIDLYTETICECKNTINLTYDIKNFVYHKQHEKLDKYYDTRTLSYKFKLKNGSTLEISSPTLGLSKKVREYVTKQASQEHKVAELSIFKYLPWTVINKSDMTDEEFKEKLKEYKSMDDITFQFLEDIVSNKLLFGIEKITGYCKVCGSEAHTDMRFPDGGAKAIFIIPDAFDRYIAE